MRNLLNVCGHLLVLCGVTIFLSACETQPTLLGLDPASAMDLMSRGSYDFLRDVDVEPSRLERMQIYGIETGSAYYTALILEELGRHELSFALLARQHQAGEQPWSDRSAIRMMQRARTADERRRAVDAVGDLLSDSAADEDIVREYMETLWRLGRHDDLLARYADLGEPAYLSAWAALAVLGLEEDAGAAVARALRAAPRDRGIIVLADELRRVPDAGGITALERDVLAFRAAVAEANWQQAGGFLADAGNESIRHEVSVDEQHPFRSRAVLADLREAWFRRRESAAGARVMEALGAAMSGASASYAYEAAGRLWRAEGANREAVRVLARAVEDAAPGTDRDRVLFHLLHARITYDHRRVIDTAALYLPMVQDPGPFNEIWERVLSHLIMNRYWPELAALYGPVRRYASGRSMAQFGVALVSALDAGLVQPDRIPDASGDTREYILEAAYLQNESIYYRKMAAAMRGVPLRAMPDDTVVFEPETPALDDLLVQGYLDFGLVDRAYNAVRYEGVRPGLSVLRRLAVSLADRGDYLRSLRTANRLTVIEGAVLDSELARIIYPEAFSDEMDRVLDEFPLDRDIFYGLVREESYFDPAIQSWVGATGLAQLMPQTAADVAGRLRVTDYDLTDPFTNLRFGARYLNDLMRQFDAWVPAMIAYNAGQGRVRTWLAERRGLPMILFHESVPLQEPRSYIRNILVSAVFYEFLSGRGDGTGVIHRLFPETATGRP